MTSEKLLPREIWIEESPQGTPAGKYYAWDIHGTKYIRADLASQPAGVGDDVLENAVFDALDYADVVIENETRYKEQNARIGNKAELCEHIVKAVRALFKSPPIAPEADFPCEKCGKRFEHYYQACECFDAHVAAREALGALKAMRDEICSMNRLVALSDNRKREFDADTHTKYETIRTLLQAVAGTGDVGL